MLRRIGHRLWLAPTTLVYLTVLALPVFFLAMSALDVGDDPLGHLYQVNLGHYAFETLALLPGVALLSVTIGVGAAWLTTIYDFPGRRWLSILLATPFCIPPFIHGFIYSEVFGIAGPFYQLLAPTFGIEPDDWPKLRSLWGATIVFSLSLYPYIYLPTRIVFLNIILRYRTVAGTLGSAENDFFLRVALPLAAGTILASTALVWMDVVSDYGLVEYFGINTITIGILRAWFGMGDLNLAAVLSMFSLLGMALLLCLVYVLRGRFVPAEPLSSQLDYPIPPKLSALKGWLCFALILAFVALVFFIPLAQLISWLMDSGSEIDLARLFSVSANTLILSLGCAILLVVTSFGLCYAGRVDVSPSWRRWYKRLRTYLSISYALPGVVVATGVIIAIEAVNGWLGFTNGNLFTIAFGLVPIVLAYQLRFSAVAVNNFDAAFEQISRDTDDSARVLGAGFFSLLWRVFMPIMTNPTRTVFLLLMINLVKELPMTSFLRPIGFDTLAVDSFIKILDERLVEAAPGALIIVMISLVLFVLLLRIFALDARGGSK